MAVAFQAGIFTAVTQAAGANGHTLLEAACMHCHSLRPIQSKRDGLVGWRFTVEEMIMRGAQLSPDEVEQLSQYLAVNFGPGISPMTTDPVPANPALDRMTQHPVADLELPEGPGAKLVQGLCIMCHDLGRVVSVQRTHTDWRRYAENMTTRAGIPQTSENLDLIATYLSKNFGLPSTD